MERAQKQLRDFMETMQPGMAVGHGPAVPGDTARELGRTLLTEEFNEVITAIDAGDIYDVAGELADLIYVALWNCNAWGVDITPVFEAIHAANMAKADGPVRADGKRERPPGWQRADVPGIVRRQMIGQHSGSGGGTGGIVLAVNGTPALVMDGWVGSDEPAMSPPATGAQRQRA